MHQQPAQTGQWPIPGPPQHRHHPHPQMPQPPSAPSHVIPYPPNPHVHLYNQSTPAAHPAYGTPYPIPPPQHWGGYPPVYQGVGVPLTPAQLSYPSAPPSVQPFYNQYRAQGLGQQAQALPSHPAASPLVQTYHQHTQQGLGQQPPVVAAEESAVKRGKRKAEDLDDAPPPKKQAIQPLVDGFDFDIIPINGKLHYRCCMPQCKNVPAVQHAGIQGHIESKQHQNCGAQLPSPDGDKAISRGDSSNIGGSSSKTQEEAVAQVPCEGSTSNMPMVFFPDSFEDYDWTSSGPLEEPVNSLDQTELAWREQVKEFFDILQKAADVAPGELEVVNSAQETDNSASDNFPESFTNSVDKTIDSASGEQSQEFINSPDETGDLAPDDLTDFYMNSFVKAEDPVLVGKLLRKLTEHWFP